MRQTNSYQTAVNGNPALSAIASGNSLSQALQRQQQKESADFLSRIIANGGNQQSINNALNIGVGNGVSPDVLNKMRGTTPDADKAAAYKAGLDNLSTIANTNKTNVDAYMSPINAQSQDLRDALLNKTSLQAMANTRDAVDENRNIKTANVLGLPIPEGSRTGGSRSWRNYNPGNIRGGEYATRMGATGVDKDGFAVFPSEEAGDKARSHLVFNTNGYKNLTLPQVIARYAPQSDGNNTQAYVQALAKAGVPTNVPMSQLNPMQRQVMMQAMKKHEGYTAGQVNQAPITNKAIDTLTAIKQKVDGEKPKNGMVHTIAKNVMEKAYATGDPVKIAEAEKTLEQYSLISGENLSTYRRTAPTAQEQATELDASLKLQTKKDILKDAKKHSPKMYQGAVEYMNRNKDNLDPTAIEQMRDGTFIPDQLNEAERTEVRSIIDNENIDTNIFNFLGDKTGQELMRSAFTDMARYKDMTGLKDPAGNTQAVKKVFARYGIEFGGDETWDLGKDVELIPGGLMDRVQKNRLSSDIVKARKDKERKEQKGEDTSKEDAQIKKYQIQLAKEFGVTENIIDFVNNIN